MTDYEIKLVNFKGEKLKTITFPNLGVLMLSGKSGIGKSTFLEAISFALYDDQKNSCYPRSDRGSKKKCDPTSVQLTFPSSGNNAGLVIFRQRRPNLLKVTSPNIVTGQLIDESAQQYLCSIFGPAGSWFSGGYLRQDQLCAFLTMNSSEKLSFLQELSLPGQFEMLFEKVTQRIQQYQQTLISVSTQTRTYREFYMTKYQLLPDSLKQIPVWSSTVLKEKFAKFGQIWVTPDESTNSLVNGLNNLITLGKSYYLKELQSKTQQIQSEHQLQAQLSSNFKLRQQCLQQLAQFEQELEKLADCSEIITKKERRISELTQEILELQQSQRQIYLTKLEEELTKKLEESSRENSPYTLDQLNQFEKIQAGPSLGQLTVLISEFEEAIAYQDYSKKKKEYLEYSLKLDNIRIKLKDCPEQSSLQQLEELKQQIWSVQLTHQKLNCPYCQKDCIYLSGRLEKSEQLHLSEKNLAELQAEKISLEQKEFAYQQRKNYEREEEKLENARKTLAFQEKEWVIPRLAEVPNLPTLLTQAQEQLQAKQTCPNLDWNAHRQQIRDYQEAQRLILELERVSKELATFQQSTILLSKESSLQILEEQKKVEQLALSKYQSQQIERISLLSKIQHIQSQLTTLKEDQPDPTKADQLNLEYQELIGQQQAFENDCNVQARLYELQGLYQQHAIYEKQEQELGQKISGFLKIRAVLITSEYVIIDLALDKINHYLNEVLKLLFDEPISMMIRSLRQMKTTDRLKPEINMEINYKGDEFNGLSDISGGQKRRISLALVIAFSQICPAPFLLLDEAMGSLDVENKERAVLAIRQYVLNKLVIAVNHDTTEGVYDRVISLT